MGKTIIAVREWILPWLGLILGIGVIIVAGYVVFILVSWACEFIDIEAAKIHHYLFEH